MGFLRRFRELLVVVVVMLVAGIFYLSNRKDPRDHNLLDRALVAISAPVQSLVVGTIDAVVGVWDGYFSLVGTKAENLALKTRIAELNADLAAGTEAQIQNARLRDLLSLKKRAPYTHTLTGTIVGTSPSPLFRSIRVDLGADDGVTLGDAVVVPQGVVGRVAAVAGSYADIILVVDANQSLDALVQRTRSRVRVRGRGGDDNFLLDVEYLARTADIESGDLLITSGLGTVFPKGLPVGRVISVTRGRFGLYQQVEVKPLVDFVKLEEVVFIPAGWPADTSFESPDLHGGSGTSSDADTSSSPPLPMSSEVQVDSAVSDGPH